MPKAKLTYRVPISIFAEVTIEWKTDEQKKELLLRMKKELVPLALQRATDKAIGRQDLADERHMTDISFGNHEFGELGDPRTEELPDTPPPNTEIPVSPTPPVPPPPPEPEPPAEPETETKP